MDTEKPSRYRTFGKRRSLRLPGFNYRQSRPCHLTWGTHRRSRALASPELAREVIDILRDEADQMGMRVLAYCLMPDHIHPLACPCPENSGDLISFVRRFKSRTTHAHWATGGIGKLWQRGFYDHVLRREEDVEQVSRYILANPVRAGFADNITQYPFSGTLINPCVGPRARR